MKQKTHQGTSWTLAQAVASAVKVPNLHTLLFLMMVFLLGINDDDDDFDNN